MGVAESRPGTQERRAVRAGDGRATQHTARRHLRGGLGHVVGEVGDRQDDGDLDRGLGGAPAHPPAAGRGRAGQGPTAAAAAGQLVNGLEGRPAGQLESTHHRPHLRKYPVAMLMASPTAPPMEASLRHSAGPERARQCELKWVGGQARGGATRSSLNPSPGPQHTLT